MLSRSSQVRPIPITNIRRVSVGALRSKSVKLLPVDDFGLRTKVSGPIA